MKVGAAPGMPRLGGGKKKKKDESWGGGGLGE